MTIILHLLIFIYTHDEVPNFGQVQELTFIFNTPMTRFLTLDIYMKVWWGQLVLQPLNNSPFNTDQGNNLTHIEKRRIKFDREKR